jgi:hypothetical protein
VTLRRVESSYQLVQEVQIPPTCGRDLLSPALHVKIVPEDVDSHRAHRVKKGHPDRVHSDPERLVCRVQIALPGRMDGIVVRWGFYSRKQRDTTTGGEKRAQVIAKRGTIPIELPDLGLKMSEEELRL